MNQPAFFPADSEFSSCHLSIPHLAENFVAIPVFLAISQPGVESCCNLSDLGTCKENGVRGCFTAWNVIPP